MRLYLRSGGRLRQWPANATGIERAFAALPTHGTATLAAQGKGGNLLLLRRSADGFFRFRVVEQSGSDAMGHRVSARRDFALGDARRLLELYAADDPAWRSAAVWKRPLLDLPVAVLAPATLLICVAGYFVVAGATGGLKGWSWRYLPNLLVGLFMVCALFAYIDWFLRRLRRRLAGRLGRIFDLRIVEAEKIGIFTRPGMWESVNGGIVSEIKVAVLDFLVLLFGLLIPIFVIATVIVLAARPILA